MKVLIAVMSCQRDRNLGYHETIRQRWGAKLSDVADIRFFLGGPPLEDLQSDEVWFDVPDDYDNLILKTLAICDWALSGNYDFLFKCDCDTSIHVNRFRNYDFKRIDYAGRFWGGQPGERGLYAAGTGYFLSKKACKIVLNYQGMSGSFEDVMVGNMLEPHICSKMIKAEHIETSLYAAIKGIGGGIAHGAAPVYVLIKRGDDGTIVARLKEQVQIGDVILNEEP